MVVKAQDLFLMGLMKYFGFSSNPKVNPEFHIGRKDNLCSPRSFKDFVDWAQQAIDGSSNHYQLQMLQALEAVATTFYTAFNGSGVVASVDPRYVYEMKNILIDVCEITLGAFGSFDVDTEEYFRGSLQLLLLRKATGEKDIRVFLETFDVTFRDIAKICNLPEGVESEILYTSKKLF